MKLWLTRSQPGAGRQAHELQAAGYQVLVAPVLGIEPTGAQTPQVAPDLVIFLSEHAVTCAQTLTFASGCPVFAVGERTAQVLAAAGIRATVPALQSSEGLLQLSQLKHVNDARVLLVCGEGGRSLLAETLSSRGASVEFLYTYRRVALASVHINPRGVGAIVIASGDGLQAALDLWQAAGGARDIPLLVPSARVAELAAQRQFTCVIQCDGADSRAILSGLKQIPVS